MLQTLKNVWTTLRIRAQDEPRFFGAVAAGAALGLFAIGSMVAVVRNAWSVEEKVILITGASSGIGKALALELVRRGAKVSLTARRQAELNEVVEECNTIRKGSAFGVPLDMSVRAMNQRAVDATLHEYGRLDVLILNAGVSAGAPVEQVNEDGLDAFEALTKTNYFGPVYATKYALPELLRNHGRIVVISSVFGIHGGPGRAFYAGSKFALHGFFESLRYEIASRDVKITMVCPGPVATDIGRARIGPDGKRAMTGHFDMKKAISADSAAERIIEALERGERLRTFSTGVSLLHRFQNFCPAFWDWIFLRGMRKLGMLDHIGVQP